MTQSNDHDHERLATRVRARRVELGLSLAALAERAGVSKGTARRVEEGQPIRDTNYAKIDASLGWAPGSCVATRDGGIPAPDLGGEGLKVIKEPIDEEGIGDAFMIVAVKNSDLPAAAIRSMKDQLIEELKQRGML